MRTSGGGGGGGTGGIRFRRPEYWKSWSSRLGYARGRLLLCGLVTIVLLAGILTTLGIGTYYVVAVRSSPCVQVPSTECLRYAQRYALGDEIPEAGPDVAVGRRTAVLIKSMPGKRWTDDLRRSFAALVREVRRVGMSVHLFYHADRDPDLLQLPPDVRPYAVPYQTADLVARFPEFVSVYRNADVACAVWMEQNPEVQFMWILEDDVRLVGDWGDFLGWMQSFHAHADFVVPGMICPAEPDWNGFRMFTKAWRIRDEDKRTAFIMVAGYSRRLGELILEYASIGKMAYMESVAPTLCHLHNLNAIEVSIRRKGFFRSRSCPPLHPEPFCESFSYYPDRRIAAAIYSAWQHDPKVCEDVPLLLHPVKDA